MGLGFRNEELAQAMKKDLAITKTPPKEKKDRLPRYPGLGRWRLMGKIGRGSYSKVYRAKDTVADNEVAIKVLKKAMMSSAQKAHILQEVQIMRNTHHPNIIDLIDFFETDQFYYIILELSPGGEIFNQIVRLSYFSEDLSRHTIVQIAEAIEYLHESLGVVHRDIKPENILFYPVPFVPSNKPSQHAPEYKIDEGEFIPGVGAGGIGRIKLADFGLSKVIWNNQTLTPCGSFGYAAPELSSQEGYSKGVDMWALGCVLYTLLCGFPPFYDESIPVLAEKVNKAQYSFLSPWWDTISEGAKDVVSRLLVVDPVQRMTIKEFLAHPWVRGEEVENDTHPTATSSPSSIDQAAEILGQMELPSPGMLNVREIFNVGYDLHRQAEEQGGQPIAKPQQPTTPGGRGPVNRSAATALANLGRSKSLFEMNMEQSTLLSKRAGGCC